MASAKWKEVNRKLDKINELKTKADLITLIVILGLFFLLIDWPSFREGGGIRLKLDVQGQGGRRMLDVAGQGGGGWGGEGLENWTIFMDVICVSFLKQLFSHLHLEAPQY